MIIESGMKFKGRLSWEVINEDGSIDKSSGGLYDNLILNSGLNLIGPSGGSHQGGGIRICNTFLYCAVGTSNAEPSVSQTGFSTTEIARTNVYNTSVGMCGSVYSTSNLDSKVVLFRTFDFPKGTFNNEDLAEVGFSPYATKADNLWSRALFKVGGTPVTVSVSPTQILRVRYELTIQFDTAWNTGKSININGVSYGYKDAIAPLSPLTTQGSTNYGIISTIDSNGSVINNNYSSSSIDPCINGTGYNLLSSTQKTEINNKLFNTSSTLSVLLTDRYSGLAEQTNYTLNNFYIDKIYKFNTSVTGDVYGLAYRGYSYYVYGYFLIFDTPFTKDNLHEMTITLRMSWGRA